MLSTIKTILTMQTNAHDDTNKSLTILMSAMNLTDVNIGLMQKYPPIFFLFYVLSFY